MYVSVRKKIETGEQDWVDGAWKGGLWTTDQLPLCSVGVRDSLHNILPRAARTCAARRLHGIGTAGRRGPYNDETMGFWILEDIQWVCLRDHEKYKQATLAVFYDNLWGS